MISIYYRSVFTIFVVFYIALYFSAERFGGKTIYVNGVTKHFLEKSSKKNRISIVIVTGHIFNVITLIIGTLGYKLVGGEMAFKIYKWSIPVFLIILMMIEKFTSEKE